MQTRQCNNLTIINQHWLCNRYYLTLNDLEVNPKNHLKEQLQQLIPNVFQDGLLNINLLKEALNEKDIANENSVFGLYWNGKNQAKATAYEQLLDKTLLPVKAKSLNFDQAQNVIIEGDNLQVLKLLTKAYFNQVDVIYIDPPYNTGNDFVYNDDFKQDSYEYKIANNLIDAQGLKTTTNQKTEGRFHTNWLNMIYPRLVLARKLLKDDGVIFISIDDNEQVRLKLICDEIFGEHNFITNFIWEKTHHSNKNSDGKKIFKNCEYVLCYVKNKKFLFLFNEGLKNNFEDAPLKNNTNIKRKYIFGPNSVYFKKKNQWNQVPLTIDFRSRWSQERIDQEIKDGTTFIIKNEKLDMIRAIYHKNKSGYQICSQLLNRSKLYFEKYKNKTTEHGTKQLKDLKINIFDYPKPKELLKYLLEIKQNKNALVLDFFAGSGTTAQAVMELNQEDGGTRQYILVQLPEPIANNPAFQTICDVTRQRVERAITKYNYDDAGFKYFQLGPTNFDVWKVQSDDDLANFQTQLKLFENADANANVNYEAILYELMLKYGLQLDYQITAQTINHHQFWADALYDHLFFLKPQPVDEILAIVKTVIAKKTNQIAVDLFIAETYFYGRQADELKINLCEQIKQSGLKVHLWVV